MVSLRTIERAVPHLRQELRAEAKATVRFETPPGRQLQIDFGEMRVPVGGESTQLRLFGATLGHSRRICIPARAPVGVARWDRGGVQSFWRAAAGGVALQCARPGRPA
jgi:transposase